ncbi:S53 family peptidase [Nonomuraea sediminis]|uniref:S53 family peptidase n=1 Tax=Nonomuraea sediminis TaxID=2835864 RepID=UPI001BDC904E|nr:S53 family peptidase [Nonomuraea sediminis]
MLVVVALALAAGCSSGGQQQSAQQAAEQPVKQQAGMDRKACQAETKTACYTFNQVRAAYGVDALQRQGITGKGRTIAILAPLGAPHLRTDLEAASTQLGLPKPHLKIVEQKPSHGKASKIDWKDEELTGMAREATMDVQAAHAMAPEADLLLYQVDVTAKRDDFDDVLRGLKQIIGKHMADVVSISFGLPEGGAKGENAARIKQGHRLLADAARQGITVVAAAGDGGAFDGTGDKQVRSVDWPASDPLVTAVGGTRLDLDDAGKRRKPDTVWSDEGGASGGGLSAIFTRPAYQRTVAAVATGRRAVPDISLSAAGDGSTMAYLTDDKAASWWPVYGTSLATPMFAGVVALAAQHAGKRLGSLNPALYDLANARNAGIVDITTGTNGKHGHPARPGYDLASGLGTVDAAHLVPALAGYAG